MALKIGELFFSLTARTSGFAKSMESAAKVVDKFGKDVKRLANDVAGITGPVVAMAAGLVHAGAQLDAGVKQQVDAVTKSFQLFAAQIAQMLMPLLKQLQEVFRTLADYIAGFTPHQREMVLKFVELAGIVTVVSLGISKFGASISAIASLVPILITVVPPLALVALALAGIIAHIVLLHAAWRTNFLGIKDFVTGFIEWHVNAWQQAMNFVSDAWAGLINSIAGFVKKGITLAVQLANVFGKDISTAASAAYFAIDGIAADLVKGDSLKQFAKYAVEKFKELGKAAGQNFVDELKLIMKELGLDKFMDGLLSKGHASVTGAAASQKGYKLKESDDVMSDGWAMPKSFGMKKAEEAAEKAAEAMAIYQARHANFRTDQRMAQYAAASAPSVASKWINGAAARIGTALAVVGDVITQTGMGLVSRMGDFGSMVNSVVSGAQAGGPAGAIAALMVDLLSRTQAFQRVIDMAMGLMQSLVSMVEPLMQALIPGLQAIFGTLGGILAPLFSALTPVFQAVGDALLQISPLLILIGMLFQGLAPMLEFFGTMLRGLILGLKPVIEGVFTVVKYIALGYIYYLRALAQLWNGIIQGVAGIVQGILLVISLGNAKWAQEVSDEIRNSASINLGGFNTAIDSLTTLTYEDAQAMSINIGATLEVAGANARLSETVNKLNQSLTNVPSGWKVAGAQFNASAALGRGGNGGGGTNFNGPVNIQANNPEELFRALKGYMARKQFEETGSTEGFGMLTVQAP